MDHDELAARCELRVKLGRIESIRRLRGDGAAHKARFQMLALPPVTVTSAIAYNYMVNCVNAATGDGMTWS